MPAYVISNYKILNPSRIDEFTALSKPINEKYQAEVIVTSPVKPVDGASLPNIVIYKFKDNDSANRWYESDERDQISELRDNVLEGWDTIVPDISDAEAGTLTGYFNN